MNTLKNNPELFDPEKGWKTAGWNSRLAGKPRKSPIVVKDSHEHRFWLFGFDAADTMIATELRIADYLSEKVSRSNKNEGDTSGQGEVSP